MRLYLLTLRRSDYGYDTYDGFVICAKNEEGARRLFLEQKLCADECTGYLSSAAKHQCIWADPERSECRLLGNAAKDVIAGIILASFRAG